MIRIIREDGRLRISYSADGDNCGDGSGGFRPGNRCAKHGGGSGGGAGKARSSVATAARPKPAVAAPGTTGTKERLAKALGDVPGRKASKEASASRASVTAPMPPAARVTPEDVKAAASTPAIEHPKSDEDVARFVAQAQETPAYKAVDAKMKVIAADSPGGNPTLWSLGKHATGDIEGTLKTHKHEAYDHIQWSPGRKAIHEEILGGMLNPEAKAKPGEKPKVVFLMGPPGCLHADTPIHDPVDGTTRTVHERWESGGDFHVWSLGMNGEPVVSRACRPWRYEPTEMLKLTFESGRTVAVTPAHRFWDGSDYVAACTLLESGEPRLPTISERDLAVQTRGVPHSTQTIPGSTGRYSTGPCPCDGRPHPGASIGRVLTRRQDDAPGHNPHCWHEDGPGTARGYNPLCLASVPHSTLDCAGQPAPHPGVGSGRRHRTARDGYDGDWCGDAPRDGRPIDPLRTDGPLLPGGSRSRRPSAIGTGPDSPGGNSGLATLVTGSRRASWRSPTETSPRDGLDTLRLNPISFADTLPDEMISCPHKFNDTDRVVKAESAGFLPYYDFHVPVLNNYWAVGFFHHNSGKTVAGQPEAMKINKHFTTVNADDIKGKLPEYEGWNAGAVHEESALLAEGPLTQRAQAARHHILMDLTGGNTAKMEQMAEAMHKDGYEVHVVSIALPAYKATGRAWDRFTRNAFGHSDPTGKTRELGRFVPPAYVHAGIDGKPEKTYQTLKSKPFVKSYVSISTDVKKGEPPRVVDRGTN